MHVTYFWTSRRNRRETVLFAFASLPRNKETQLIPIRVSLNWPLNALTPSNKAYFGRALFHQDIIHKHPRTVNDDIWTFNTQVSSQWDGLRHFAYQAEKKFYNGVTIEDIHGPGYKLGEVTRDTASTVNGIQGSSLFSSISKSMVIILCRVSL